MPFVVADTGPLNYIVLIGEIDILPRLFDRVLTPQSVIAELDHARTPTAVQKWVASRPAWLSVGSTPPMTELPLPTLDEGERAAIALALSEKANLVLMDERAGARAALASGLSVVGTVGVLEMAARRDMVDLSAAFARLRRTSFRIRQQVLDRSLASYEAERGLP